MIRGCHWTLVSFLPVKCSCDLPFLVQGNTRTILVVSVVFPFSSLFRQGNSDKPTKKNYSSVQEAFCSWWCLTILSSSSKVLLHPFAFHLQYSGTLLLTFPMTILDSTGPRSDPIFPTLSELQALGQRAPALRASALTAPPHPLAPSPASSASP